MSFKLYLEDDIIGPHIWITYKEMRLSIVLGNLTQFRIHENFCIINGTDGDFYISWTERMITVALDKNKIGAIHLTFPSERSEDAVRFNIREVFAEAKHLIIQDPPKYEEPIAVPAASSSHAARAGRESPIEVRDDDY